MYTKRVVTTYDDIIASCLTENDGFIGAPCDSTQCAPCWRWSYESIGIPRQLGHPGSIPKQGAACFGGWGINCKNSYLMAHPCQFLSQSFYQSALSSSRGSSKSQSEWLYIWIFLLVHCQLHELFSSVVFSFIWGFNCSDCRSQSRPVRKIRRFTLVKLIDIGN